LRDGACFALEAIAEFRRAGDERRQRLDGDDAVEPRVTRLVDLAHSARADGAEDLVRAEACAVGKSHTVRGF
jgi:hypothetical protein